MQKRQTAFKLWISNIVNSPFIKKEGEWEPNYLDFDNNQISRVNLIATVVDKFDNENYCTIILDDGSGEIRVRAFKDDIYLLKNLKKGEIVSIIGRLREYNNEVYIIPEIVNNVNDPNFELLRKIELLKSFGKPKFEIKIENKPVVYNESEAEEENKDVSHSAKQKILNIIEKGPENGIGIQEIITNSGLNEEEANVTIKELLKQGEIYQPRPGYLSIL